MLRRVDLSKIAAGLICPHCGGLMEWVIGRSDSPVFICKDRLCAGMIDYESAISCVTEDENDVQITDSGP